MRRRDRVRTRLRACGRSIGAVRLSARVRLFRCDLDRRISRGESPWTDAALTRRVDHLQARGERGKIARGLARVLDLADAAPCNVPSAVVPIRRAAVRDQRDSIERLIRRLTDDDPVRAEGVVLARCLLTDGTGPLYCPSPQDTIGTAARRALAHL